MVAVSDACEGAKLIVLNNVVQYASSELRTVMMADYDFTRTDYLHQAEELSHFAQSVENDVRSRKAVGRDVVASISDHKPRADTRKCYSCQKIGHIALNCKSKRSKTGKADVKEHFTLAVRDLDTSERDMWILDSGSSRHLISDESLLENTKNCESECVQPNLTNMGSVLLTVKAGEKQHKI